MRKKILLFMICIGAFCSANGQSVFNQVFSTSGGGGTMNSYTLGETFIMSDNITLTEGFHQVNWQIVPLVKTRTPHDIKIFPNPTTQALQVQTDYNSTFELAIKDLLGKELINRRTENKLSTFDVSDFPSATYLISVRDLMNGEQWIYKFTKKDN